MRTLLVGFDSAWAFQRRGAFVGVLRDDEGTYCELGEPKTATFAEAETGILGWQDQYAPDATVVMIDQPITVENAAGQRPVENLVSSPVGRRYGGVQPANTSRRALFGHDAPVWRFLNRFGGTTDPLGQPNGMRVIETFPVLAMIALRWTLSGDRPTGRLPKYNPTRRRNFSISDWNHVCQRASSALQDRGLTVAASWLDSDASRTPTKRNQDCVDACICLLVALHLVEGERCLMIGDIATGYMVAPFERGLSDELEERCRATCRVPSEWVHSFCLPAAVHSRAQDGSAARS